MRFNVYYDFFAKEIQGKFIHNVDEERYESEVVSIYVIKVEGEWQIKKIEGEIQPKNLDEEEELELYFEYLNLIN